MGAVTALRKNFWRDPPKVEDLTLAASPKRCFAARTTLSGQGHQASLMRLLTIVRSVRVERRRNALDDSLPNVGPPHGQIEHIDAALMRSAVEWAPQQNKLSTEVLRPYCAGPFCCCTQQLRTPRPHPVSLLLLAVASRTIRREWHCRQHADNYRVIYASSRLL